jgi:dTDP-4-dehydrorhamnose reductase
LAKLSTDLSFKFVQFSSDYVFNGESSIGYDEFAVTDPINFYGETKLLAENAIAQYSDNFIIQRISWLFGPNKTNFVDFVAKELIANNPVKIVTDQTGTPTYSCDVVKACLELLSINGSGIYHTTNAESVSWYELALEVCEALKVSKDLVQPILSTDLNRLAKRPACSILYTTRLNPLRSHKVALDDYLNI